MGNARKSALDRILFTPWILIGLLALLAGCWWTISFNLWTLDHKLGFWIASKGWDSGPSDEYPYDFILFWHLSLSALVYLGILDRIQAKARMDTEQFHLSDFLNARAVKFLFLYPVLCTAIIWVFPWNDIDTAGHKIFSLMIYPTLFCSLTLIALGSCGKLVPRLLIQVVCCSVATLSFFSPIYGRGVDIPITTGIALAVTVWALVTIKAHVARIRSAY